MSFKARRALIRYISCENSAFAAVVLCQQESHFNMSFNDEHVSQFSSGSTLPQGVHLVSSAVVTAGVEYTALAQGYLDGVRAAIDRKRQAQNFNSGISNIWNL